MGKCYGNDTYRRNEPVYVLGLILLVKRRGSIVKKVLAVATAIAAFGFVDAASAADMPTKAPAYAPVAVYNWTGFYVGASVGGQWLHYSGQVTAGPAGAGA